jgi:hypothetical protein
MTPIQSIWAVGLALFAAVLFSLLMMIVQRPAAKIEKAERVSERAIRTIPIVPQSPPSWAIPPQRTAQAAPPKDDDQENCDVPCVTPKELARRRREWLKRSRAIAEPAPVIEDPPEKHHRIADICARTGGRKVETHHGRSWRCAYR